MYINHSAHANPPGSLHDGVAPGSLIVIIERIELEPQTEGPHNSVTRALRVLKRKRPILSEPGRPATFAGRKQEAG